MKELPILWCAERGKWISASIFLALFMVPVSALAGAPIRFSNTELGAFTTLVKPELTTIRLDGRKGEFRPGPSLLFAGLEPQDFNIDLNLGADLVDLRFHEFRAKAPTLSFAQNRIRIEIAFGDQAKAIRSTLGSISFRGVKAVAWLSVSSENGVRLGFEKGELLGELKGTGLLRPRWVIDAVRKIVLRSLKSEVERTLKRASVQESIEKGFITWAQFSTEPGLTRVLPNSVQISESGITYEAE